MSPRSKIPTKAELIQLQKLYRTDEKIGERLGGVPAYLVAYWRRKKNVPRHSVPKFSDKEIRSLWERFGDDDRCGLELGISKAAFYNWRRRYGIREKPAFLKLEQLELHFPGMSNSSRAASHWNKQTVVQKIFAERAATDTVEVGDTVELEPDLLICDRSADKVIQKFRQRPGGLMLKPSHIHISLAEINVDRSGVTSEISREVRRFAERHRLTPVIAHSAGCCHQILMERGVVMPGMLCFGGNDRIASLGAINSLGWQVDLDSQVTLLAEGKLSATVPATLRVDITGRRSRGVYAGDIALSIMKRMSDVEIADKVIEYYGPSVSQMTISERFTLCSMAHAMGAVSAICPFDSATRRYLTGRSSAPLAPKMADKNAVYEQHYQINVDQLSPQIAPQGKPTEIKPVAEMETFPVNRILIGSATNGRFDDLRAAADVLKGKKINKDTTLLVYPASQSVFLEALKKGLIRALAEAGAVIMTPGCGIHDLPDWARPAGNDRCLVTGPVEGLSTGGTYEVYQCSPATAAASALNGAVTDPTRYVK